MAEWKVEIVRHDTNANNADPTRGVETLRDMLVVLVSMTVGVSPAPRSRT